MLRSLLFVVAFMLIAAAETPAPRLPRENLLLYRDADGKPQPVKSVEDWAKRRGRDRARHGIRDGQAARQRETLSARRED